MSSLVIAKDCKALMSELSMLIARTCGQRCKVDKVGRTETGRVNNRKSVWNLALDSNLAVLKEQQRLKYWLDWAIRNSCVDR